MSDVIRLKARPTSYRPFQEAGEINSGPQATINPINEKIREDERKAEIAAMYQRGYEEGYAAARNELEREFSSSMVKKTEEFYAILSNFEQKLIAYEQSFEEIVASVSLKIAEKIVKREINTRSIVEETVRTAAQKIVGANEVIIKINPADYELLSNEYHGSFDAGFEKVKFEVTTKVEPGGCLIESEIGNVDARIDTQLEEITRAFEQYFHTKTVNSESGENE